MKNPALQTVSGTISEAGLPTLPDGYFFRVKKWNYRDSEYSLIVQLRRSTWWGSYKVSDSVCAHTAGAVAMSAGFALERAQSRIRKQLTIRDRAAFVGDYPPKTLGSSDV